MYRLWLWPLVIVCNRPVQLGHGGFQSSQVAIVVPLTMVGAAVRLDLRLCGRYQSQTDTVLKNVSGQGNFGLSRGSQIALGVFALLFALVMFAMGINCAGQIFTSIGCRERFVYWWREHALLPRKYRGLLR